VKVGILHEVEDRREGFLQYRTALSRHFNQRGPGIMSGGIWHRLDTAAADNLSAKLSGLCQDFLHSVKGCSVDQRADENGTTRERVADLHRGIDLFQFGDQSIIDIAMQEQP